VLTADSNWLFFTPSSSGESASGNGRYLEMAGDAAGSALVVLTEGPGGANSDWLELTYSLIGDFEAVTATWQSDSDPGGLPALPTGVTPKFLAESGSSQDVTDLLRMSAAASGFAFPTNLTVQVQSDAPETVPAPLIGFGFPAFVAVGGILFGARLLERGKRPQLG
jgi:hypothetical protein